MPVAASDLAYLRTARPQDDIFRVISPAEWEGKEPPRRDWMVERCFVRGSVGLVSGDGGIGKSLLMQQLCTCAALGRPFLGLACQPGRALFFGAEDDRDELWRRQHDICRTLGTTMCDVADAGLMLAPRVTYKNALTTLCRDRHDPNYWQMVPTPLLSRITEFCLSEGVQYVVIDTATQTFSGNQNDEQQVTQYCNIMRRLAVAIQGCVLITKHPSVAGRALGTGESGSVSWNNSVRSRLYMHRDKDKRLTLAAKKSNYGPADLELPIRWERGCYLLDQPEPPRAYGYRDD